ncbi:MAG: dihydroorotate dehydrogenase electron transfer subunit, partial [Oscillospiraceae bacterium]
MAESKILDGLILSNEEIASDIFKMTIYAKDAFATATAGRFVNLYTGDASMLLPRPISICDSEKDTVTLIYRVSGKGTKLFSAFPLGRHIKVSTPLGNGYN